MELRFSPYDFKYKVQNEKTYVYLYSKLEDGTKVCVMHEYAPYFYADISDERTITLLKDFTLDDKGNIARIVRVESIKKELLGKTKFFVKITVNYPKAVPLIAKDLAERGIQCYETKIIFIDRYVRDNGITPMTMIQATGDFSSKGGLRVPLFEASTVESVSKETHKSWKICALDIETYAVKKEINPHKNPILMVAFYGVDENDVVFRKVITWRKFNTKLNYLEVVSDEVELLKRVKEILIDYQPDIVTGYFSDGFDFPYIKTRADKHGVVFDIGADYSQLDIRKKAGFRSSEARITGMLHLDMLQFIRNIFGKNLKTDSYSLNAVSHELLDSKKHDVDINNLAHVWDHDHDKLEDFCKYNLHDAHLTYQLCKKLLFDILEFTKIVGLPSHNVIRMRFSKLVENYILKRAIEYNVIAPNKPIGSEMKERMEESIQGAFVYEPTPGIYENIVVFDFRSLYPTIITAHNIGPESLQCDCCKANKVPGREQYWFCSQDRKFIPTVLEQLVLRRVDLKRLIKDARNKNEDTRILDSRSYALKILANSFYGYLGFFNARWYCLECAASTTAYARHYIQSTIQKAETKGFKVVYADTDSCFLVLEDNLLDKAMEFMNEINFDLPGHMELEYEGFFPRGIFVAVKGSDKGAKKKYALMRDDDSIKITGFETVRRNWSLLAKEVQEDVLRLVLQDKGEEAVQYVKDIIVKLKNGTISPEKLILKTQITRELSQYTSFGPHVIIAKKLQDRGEKIVPGTVVEYIIVQGSGLVRERARIPSDVKKGEYDIHYYLNNQLLPAVSSIFSVLGYSEDDLLGKGKQTGLGNFF
ncbi:hypothetical protein HOL21_02980 [Candidatus Woesearchaeota archaeon]|jgi:DNA polymerase, archaea type|nr:hypothetical protein [Candidatus Woesearchaeota archaeon]MBT5397151.1 hypothetical protein [Candidatus Woesearchaeota archaeon]MBT6367303.1 hypothetical protein [Candidatus Woesearchaeota archaeon]MBT7762551.1 hypothetical protein [Candidatus Woesearchaeota archaeon]